LIDFCQLWFTIKLLLETDFNFFRFVGNLQGNRHFAVYRKMAAQQKAYGLKGWKNVSGLRMYAV
jgi:hypothetical protein